MIEEGAAADEGEEEEGLKEEVCGPKAFEPPVGSFCVGKQRGMGRRVSREGRGGGGEMEGREGGGEGSLGGERQCGQWR